SFMKKRWLSFPILLLCFGLIALFYTILKKETAPYDDRSYLRLSVTAPEGASFDYMERFMDELTQVVNDSIPEKKVNLVITSPSFGGRGSVNSGIMIMNLVQPDERDQPQQEIAERLTRITRKYPEARTVVTQQPTISVNRRGGQPIQYIIQAQNFQKLEEKIPQF